MHIPGLHTSGVHLSTSHRHAATLDVRRATCVRAYTRLAHIRRAIAHITWKARPRHACACPHHMGMRTPQACVCPHHTDM
eukprot:5869162-Alexandrium_andersonii.AAC.1